MPNYEPYKRSVAIYLRKSRQDPSDESIEETLERHSAALMKAAREQDLNITGIYKEVVSGDGLFTRPQMVQLLQDIETDMYTAVLCVAIDRLGRSSQKDGGIILEALQEHNVCIITPNRTYNLDDEIDEQSVEMQSFIARQELKIIKRRLRTGLKASLESGYHVTEPPYGYERTYINRRPTLRIVEDEAAAVRTAFDMYVNQGIGTTTIARTLNSMGYKPHISDAFSRSSIAFMLKNPTYAGKIVWNKQKFIRKKNPNDTTHRKPNPESEWIISDGVHPAIVDADLWDKAQSLMSARFHPPVKSHELKNYYSGVLFCKHCGAPLTRSQGNKHHVPYLMCAKPSCNRSVKMEYMDRHILTELRNLLVDCSVDRVNPSSDKASRDTALSLTRAKSTLNTLRGQRSRLHDLLEQGVYDTDTFLERSKTLAAKIKDTENTVSTLEAAASGGVKQMTAKDIIPTLRELINDYDSLSPIHKNRMLKSVFKRVEYEKTASHATDEFTLNIELNFIM